MKHHPQVAGRFPLDLLADSGDRLNCLSTAPANFGIERSRQEETADYRVQHGPSDNKVPPENRDFRQLGHRVSTVLNHGHGRVPSTGSHNSAARMSSTATEIQAADRSPVITPARDRTHTEQLMQGHTALKNVTAG